jgi:5-methylcytosine-specific restriction endonuclease McrA
MSFYSTAEWKRLRRSQLQAKPFCAFCQDLDVRTPATVVDHKTPHKGDKALFFNALNLQSLCKTCHDSAKQRYEKSGSLKGGNQAGMPFDAQHHWNKI